MFQSPGIRISLLDVIQERKWSNTPILSFKQKQTLRKNYFGEKMKACQYLLKLFAVVYITVLPRVLMQIIEWTLAMCTWWDMVPEIGSQLNRENRMTSCGATDPLLGAITEQALVEHQPGASPACPHPMAQLSASPSSTLSTHTHW